MQRIFISYRRDDSAADVGRLYDALRQNYDKSQIFMDIEAIKPGEHFTQVIKKAIHESGVVLVVIGPQWLTLKDNKNRQRLLDPNDFVRLEVEAALRSDAVVIPVLVRGAHLPAKEDLPEDLRSLVNWNALEFSDRHFREDVDILIRRLQEIITPEATPTVERADVPETSLLPVTCKGKQYVLQLTNVLGIETELAVDRNSVQPAIESLSHIGSIVVEIDSGVYIGTWLDNFRKAVKHDNQFAVYFADGWAYMGYLGGTVIASDRRKYNLSDVEEINLINVPENASPAAARETPIAWSLEVIDRTLPPLLVTNPAFLFRTYVASNFPPGSGNYMNDTAGTIHVLHSGQEVESNLVDFKKLVFSGGEKPEVTLLTPRGREITSPLKVKDRHSTARADWYLIATVDNKRRIALKPQVRFVLTRET